MRALLIDKETSLEVDTVFNYKGEYLHHLVNVSRIKPGERLLLLNGEGCKWLGEVLKINKKEVEIAIKEKEKGQLPCREIAFCLVKKESLEQVVKIIVELGCSRLTVIYSDYSQNYDLNLARIKRIMDSALMQSNNAYRPEVVIEKSFSNFLKEKDVKIVALTTTDSTTVKPLDKGNLDKKVLLVGPEGGFSKGEIILMDQMGVERIKFDLPILRTSTAIGFGVGFLLSRSMSN